MTVACDESARGASWASESALVHHLLCFPLCCSFLQVQGERGDAAVMERDERGTKGDKKRAALKGDLSLSVGLLDLGGGTQCT